MFVTLDSVMLWHLTPCPVVEIKRWFKGTCLLSPNSSSVKMEAARPSETSVIFYHTRRRQPSEDSAILTRIIEANEMYYFSTLFR